MAQNTSPDSLSVLTGINAEYIAHMYNQYLVNPESVTPGWRQFFEDMADDEAALLRELNGASWTPAQNRKAHRGFDSFVRATHGAADVGPAANQNAGRAGAPIDRDSVRQSTLDSIQALMLIRAFRARGHLIANLDPLGMKERDYHPELDPAHYGFTAGDYDRPIFINGVLGRDSATLREILSILHDTYCGTIGVEFLHMSDPDESSGFRNASKPRATRPNFPSTANARSCNA
jgi:2-oxoglutarate dehydrogenase E1 component